MADGKPLPDEAFLDDAPRRPLLRFNYRWTGPIVALMGFTSIGLTMSILSFLLGLLQNLPKVNHLQLGIRVTIIAAILLSHLVSVVGAVSTPLYGLGRTGDVAAVMIGGRRFSGHRLGVFYLACFASPWLVYAFIFLLR